MPFVLYGTFDTPRVSWYEFLSLASSVDNCLQLIFVVLLVLLIRHLAMTDSPAKARGTWARRSGNAREMTVFEFVHRLACDLRSVTVGEGARWVCGGARSRRGRQVPRALEGVEDRAGGAGQECQAAVAGGGVPQR